MHRQPPTIVAMLSSTKGSEERCTPLLRRGTAICCFALLLILIVDNFRSALPRTKAIYDYGSFYLSGRAVDQGVSPFDRKLATSFIQREQAEICFPNRNPPLWFPLFQGFAKLDPFSGFRIWWWSSLLLFAGLVGASCWQHKKVAALKISWAFAMAGLWATLGLGQIYVCLLALVCLAGWSLARNNSGAGAVAIGLLVALKPNFAFCLVALAVLKRWKICLPATATALLLTTASVIVYGDTVFTEWLAAVQIDPADLDRGTNFSLVALLNEVLPFRCALLVTAVVAFLTLLAIRNRNPTALQAFEYGLIGSLLFSPIAWIGYTLVLIPHFLRSSWSRLQLASALLLLVPSPLVWAAAHQGTDMADPLIASVYTLAVVLVMGSLLEDIRKQPGEPSTGHMCDKMDEGRARPAEL